MWPSCRSWTFAPSRSTVSPNRRRHPTPARAALRGRPMAELTQKERLQPSLLDRLTDTEPEQRQESREKRILSPSRLRESVRRDLTWLFNTPNLATMLDLANYPQVAESVVNYGLPSLAGPTTSSVDIPQ